MPLTNLHQQLIERYAAGGHPTEQPVDGYIVDVVRDGEMIEVQTTSLGAIRRKVRQLATRHRVRVVWPLPARKYIVKQRPDEEPYSRRRSPGRWGIMELFRDLPNLVAILPNPNVSLEVVLTEEEELRVEDGQGSWRRSGRWSRGDRRLLRVVRRREFRTAEDFAALLPKRLRDPFTCRDLARAIKRPLWLAQKAAYCLQHVGAIRRVGKRRNAYLYERAV